MHDNNSRENGSSLSSSLTAVVIFLSNDFIRSASLQPFPTYFLKMRRATSLDNIRRL